MYRHMYFKCMANANPPASINITIPTRICPIRLVLALTLAIARLALALALALFLALANLNIGF